MFDSFFLNNLDRVVGSSGVKEKKISSSYYHFLLHLSNSPTERRSNVDVAGGEEEYRAVVSWGERIGGMTLVKLYKYTSSCSMHVHHHFRFS